MKNKSLDTILRSNNTMITSLVSGLIFGLGHIFAYLMSDSRSSVLTLAINLFIVLTLIVTFMSYASHDKNVMKFTLGSILTLVIVGWILVLCLDNFNFFSITLLLLSVGIYLIHMLINADRHSSPELVKFNQIACILYLVISLINVVYLLINLSNLGTLVVISSICTSLLYVSALLSCIFIESNLDTYRKAREAKGWKEQ